MTKATVGTVIALPAMARILLSVSLNVLLVAIPCSRSTSHVVSLRLRDVNQNPLSRANVRVGVALHLMDSGQPEPASQSTTQSSLEGSPPPSIILV